MTRDAEGALRSDIVRICRLLSDKDLVKGTSGNVSARLDDGLLVTPTGVDYERLAPDQIVRMAWDGSFAGDWLPTSEWHFHLEILRQRQDLNAVVHTHSPFATSVAILGRDIPAIHYRIAVAGGPTIRCAPYATFGTPELAALAIEALDGRRACLLAHHGVIAAHETLDKALAVAEVVEELARFYIHCLPAGDIPTLSNEEIATVIEKHKTYGQQPR